MDRDLSQTKAIVLPVPEFVVSLIHRYFPASVLCLWPYNKNMSRSSDTCLPGYRRGYRLFCKEIGELDAGSQKDIFHIIIVRHLHDSLFDNMETLTPSDVVAHSDNC